MLSINHSDMQFELQIDKMPGSSQCISFVNALLKYAIHNPTVGSLMSTGDQILLK